eukprot:gene335-3702_t
MASFTTARLASMPLIYQHARVSMARSLYLKPSQLLRPIFHSRESLTTSAYLRSGEGIEFYFVLYGLYVCVKHDMHVFSNDIIDKQYSAKVENLVTEISTMTILEVADLIDALKTRLNISDMPVAAVAAPAAAATGPAEPEVVQTEFEVKLVGFNDKSKIKVIKEVRNILPNLKLAEAKKLVEELPQTLKRDISKEDAENLKLSLTEIGATVEIV